VKGSALFVGTSSALFVGSGMCKMENGPRVINCRALRASRSFCHRF